MPRGAERFSTWLHVSPGRNLDAILAGGLVPNDMGGNYAGYETSLDGVYVCRNLNILRSHVVARQADEHFLVAIVKMEPTAEVFIDEDAIHSWLEVTASKVLGEHGLSIRDAVDGDIQPENPIWGEVAPALHRNLGSCDMAVADQNPGLLEEYVDAWIRHDIYAEDVDGLWWPGAKDTLVRMYPDMGHPAWRQDFLSLRVPNAIGFDGEVKLVGIVEMTGFQPKLVFGEIPDDAVGLISSLLGETCIVEQVDVQALESSGPTL